MNQAKNHTRQEDLLRQNVALQQLLMRMATKFVNVPIERIDKSIYDALEEIGTFVRVDRAYLFKYDFAHGTMSNTHEWCDEDISREIENSQGISNELLSDVVNAHRKGEVYVLPCVADLPPDDGFRAILEPQSIQSLILFPMIYDTQLLGFVGFDSVRQARVFTETETDLLKVLAEILANAVVRRRSDEVLLESEEKFRALVEATSDLIWEVDANCVYTYVSPQIKNLLGFLPEEVLGKKPFDLMVPERAERVKELFEEVVKSKKSFSELENLNLHKDGHVVVLETSGVPILDKSGLLRGYRGIDRDITRRKRAEDRLIANEKRYRALFDLSPAGIMLTDAKGTILEVNDAFQRSHLYSRDDLVGRDIRLLVPDAEDFRVDTHLARILEGETLDHEVVNIRKDGSLCLVELRETAIVLPDGRQGVLTVANDITKRKRAEEALRISEEQYRALFENAPIGIGVADQSGNLLAYNEAMLKPGNYSVDDVRKVGNVAALYYDITERTESLALLARQGFLAQHPVQFKRKDGTPYDAMLTLTPIHFKGQNCVLALVEDATYRKLAEEALRSSEERYRRFFEEDLAGNLVSTPEGKILDCNPSFVRIFGFASREEALKGNATRMYGEESQRDDMLRLLRQKKKLQNIEMTLRRADGTPVHVLENIIGSFDAQGNLVQIMGYIFDQTMQKHLEQQLIQSQKMESLGTLASGIAHDFNNILGIILGHASLLSDARLGADKSAHHTRSILKATERGVGVVKQLLTFARKTDMLLEPVHVNDIVQELAKLLSETLPRNITIVTDLCANLSTVAADANQMHQVVLNLSVNARDAMPGGGRLTISTSEVSRDELRRIWRDASAPSYVVLSVADTGTGIDELTRERIFEPFFTTKERGKGTGLGLATVYGVVQTHKGWIDVQSQQGQGAVFSIYFPVHTGVVEARATDISDSSEAPGGNETILLVEDEPMLQEMLSELLIAKGYKVVTAMDGVQGLELYSQHNTEIALVVSDLGLPLLGGDDLFVALKSFNPTVKFILASGFVDPAIKAKLTGQGLQHIVNKPYFPAQVLRKIREVIDSKAD